MANRIKRIILKNFLDIRLKFVHNIRDVYNFPDLVKNLKNILVILPQKENMPVRQFPSELYKIFPDVNISTFDIGGLRRADCNWLGVPHEHYLNQVREGNFDLVIDLNTAPDRVCSYITAFSGAKVRMNLIPGRYDHIYNFQVRSDSHKSTEEKLHNILIYLSKLKNLKGLK